MGRFFFVNATGTNASVPLVHQSTTTATDHLTSPHLSPNRNNNASHTANENNSVAAQYGGGTAKASTANGVSIISNSNLDSNSTTMTTSGCKGGTFLRRLMLFQHRNPTNMSATSGGFSLFSTSSTSTAAKTPGGFVIPPPYSSASTRSPLRRPRTFSRDQLQQQQKEQNNPGTSEHNSTSPSTNSRMMIRLSNRIRSVTFESDNQNNIDTNVNVNSHLINKKNTGSPSFPVTDITIVNKNNKAKAIGSTGHEERQLQKQQVTQAPSPLHPQQSVPLVPEQQLSPVQPPVIVRRQRFNSRDIPTTYAGQYGSVDTDLLPLECMRVHTISPTIFLGAYFTIIFAIQVVSIILISSFATAAIVISSSSSTNYNNITASASFMSVNCSNSADFLRYCSTIIPTDNCIVQVLLTFWNNVYIDSWTVTNGLHLLTTIAFIHWSKGRNSFLLLSGGMDEQGEMNAMTVWEQLEAVPDSVTIRHILLVVPTILTYIACVTANFQKEACFINITFWLISMLAKLPCMNGVRLFGINRTAGIDDYDEQIVPLFDDRTKLKLL